MTDKPEFGVLLPTREMYAAGGGWDVQQVVHWAVDAEELGFASVWAGDALRLARLEPLVTLAAVAAVTRRVTLGTAAIVPALRQVVMGAQAVTSLDILSRGRLVLTVGAGFPGMSNAQFGTADVDYSTRYSRLDDIVALWRAMWMRGPQAEFHGKLLHLESLPGIPPPARPGGPPVWYAGATPAGLQKTGRMFDGWMPYPPDVRVYAAGLERVRAAAEQAGRDPTAITPSLYATVLVEPDLVRAEQLLQAYCEAFYELPLATVRALQLMIAGPSEYVRERIGEFVAAGARHIVLRIAALAPGDQLARVAEALGVQHATVGVQ